VTYDNYTPPKSSDGFWNDTVRFIGTPLGMILFALLIVGPLLFGFRNVLIYYMISKSATTIQQTGEELKRDPSNVDAHLRRAQALKTAFLYWDAVNECTAAIRVSPSPSLYRMRADMYDCAGKPDLAKNDRDTAASLEHH
jgi:hypothetical protein